MGMKRKLFNLFLLSACGLSAISCGERNAEPLDRVISFDACIASADISKAVYGDISGSVQPLYWQLGDRITVFCSESLGDIHRAEYSISSLQPGSYTTDNYASVTNVTEDVLQWNTGNHTFYAVSPGITVTGCSLDGNVITGKIPASQNAGAVSGSGNKVVAPDMNNMYMVAKTVYPTDAIPPILTFKPMTTAVQITLENGFRSESSLNVSSISLTSASKFLSGGFKIDMDQAGENDRQKTVLDPATAANGSTVSVNFDTPVAVAYGKSITVTLFLNPGNTVDDLTLTVAGTNAGNGNPYSLSTVLEYGNGNGVVFATHKKTILSGLVLPERIEWKIDNQLVVTPWVNAGTGIPLGI